MNSPLQTVGKEVEAYQHLHEGENVIVLASPEEWDKARLVIDWLCFDWGMNFRAMLEGVESPEKALDAIDAQKDASVIVLTESGGIADEKGQTLPLLTRRKIKDILKGEHSCIGTMQKETQQKIEFASNALRLVPKVTFTSAQELPNEISTWMGAGTMAIDQEHLALGKIDPEYENPIFRAMYEYYSGGKFRNRSKEELNSLEEHHWMLRLGKTPLGGVSLVPKGNEWRELSALWAGTLGQGIGREILRKMPKTEQSTYALSTDRDAMELFRSEGFRNPGTLADSVKLLPGELQRILRSYDTSKRNPHIFLQQGNL